MRWLAATVIAMTGLVSARPARANVHSTEFVATVLAVGLVDVGFTFIDFGAAANDGRSNAWLIPQAFVTTPQALLLNGAFVAEPEPSTVGLGIWVNQLAAFSIYGWASPDVSTRALYGISFAIGANTALTSNALGVALDGRFSSRAVALTEMVASVPQLTLAALALDSPTDYPRQRAALFALGAWSSALFVHGVLSLALYRPKPLPSETPKEQAWFVVPSLIGRELGPAPGAGISRVGVPGLLMRGVF